MVVVMVVLGVFASSALAASGHFIQQGNKAPSCTDIGTQVNCTGKVAGLAGETFEIRIAAEGTAQVVCINPGGNRAPGQDTAITVPGTSGPLATPRNGQYNFSITSDPPDPLPSVPTCPNAQWTPEIVDVTFSTVFFELYEDGVLVDTATFHF